MTTNRTYPYGQGRYVDVNGLRLYVEEHGVGRPLLLIHGGPATSEMWQPYLPFLAPRYRVITPDSRAQGRTNNPAGTLSYALLADDMAALIKHLRLDRPLVFGYSDGAQVALELAMRYPGLTGPVAVVAAWHRFTEAYAARLRAGGFPGPGEVDLIKIQRDSPRWVKMLQEDHVSSPDPDYWQVLLRQCATLWWTPLNYTAADLARITAPVLVAMGDRDGSIELEQALEMYRLIPRAELAILPNATHGSPNEELLSTVLLDFFARRASKPIDNS